MNKQEEQKERSEDHITDHNKIKERQLKREAIRRKFNRAIGFILLPILMFCIFAGGAYFGTIAVQAGDLTAPDFVKAVRAETFGGQEPQHTHYNVPGMIEESKDFMASPPNTNPWVNEIVQRHIPVGSPKEELFNELERHNFKIYPVPKKYVDAKKHDETYTALITFWLFPRYLFKHKLRVIMHFRNEKLADIEGRVIYQSL
ncbi:hypothetical protein MJD09_03300 [bacterium]|nr:hypothetical protein [bacterium]